MAKFHVEYSEKDVISLVHADLIRRFPEIAVDRDELHFLVKSQNNYRPQEWEKGALKVEVDAQV